MEALMNYLAAHFDLPILEWIAENLRCAFLDAVMPAVTVLGDSGIFWILLAIMLVCVPKYRKIGLTMGAAMLIGLLVCNITLKPLIARPRPYDYQLTNFGKQIELLIPTLRDYSFPSGHTLASFESAIVLLIQNKKLGIPALILASLIAFSRLYLYVHYPTDVLFSVALGVGIAFFGNWLMKKLFPYLEARNINLG